MFNRGLMLLLVLIVVGCGETANQPTTIPASATTVPATAIDPTAVPNQPTSAALTPSMVPSTPTLEATNPTTATISNPQSTEEVLAFIRQNPSNVSLVSYSTNSDGSINNADPLIEFNAQQALPLASTMKIVILASYAQAVEAGTLDPEQPISLADWEAWYWPNTDGGAHPAALKRLGIPADQRGFANDQAQTVPLKSLAQAMIFESDNAATDYLIDRLGIPALDQTIVELGMQQQTKIVPIVGLFLLVMNPDAPADATSMQTLLELDQAGIEQQALALAERYQAEPEWRKAAQDQTQLQLDLAQQSQVFAHIMPKGSASDYAKVMALVGNNQLLSPAVSQTMREFLEWPMTIPGNETMFTHFGTKGGSLPGILTEAMFIQPAQGEWADRTKVVVLFFNQLPEQAWMGLMQSFIQQQFAVQLALDPTFAESVASQLK
ncbi:serine hydrolase [Herpetosiphon geysericola]|uniref:serine hydrolase n=1 Tax=Herpetosiphon geysericola TaxID=70996 RepID=UPI0006C8FC1D|nr:serine hydrolase [Herpetosiphon geysericola]